MLSLFGSLVVVALAAATALVGMTAAISKKTAEVGVADARMRASLRTKAALLWFSRESDISVLRPTADTFAQRAGAEADLLADVDETRRLATPDRLPQLDHLVLKCRAYVALRAELERQGLPLDAILQRATRDLESVFADLQQLVASDTAWTARVESSARRLDATADVLGGVAAGALLLGLAVAFVGSNRLFQRPVLALSDSIARYGRGEHACRARPSGPREIRHIAVVFNDLADRIARQENDRLRFLAGVAHDLRNPLAPLMFAVAKLRLASQPPAVEGSAKVLELVQRQVVRLDRMVGDLLDATSIESGKLDLHPQAVDLGPLLHHVADLYRPGSPMHAIDVQEPGDPVVVWADPVRIEQVVINLVSNAIKYSPEGGPVRIALAASGEHAVVSVSDEGIGISAEERDRIFEPFHRSALSRDLIPGVGLGLAVARKIAQAHGGDLDVESTGTGSTFRLSLPLGEAPPR